MGKIADIIKKFLLGFFNKALLKGKSFFSKPKALVALQLAALAILAPLLVWLKKLLENKLSQIRDKNRNDLSTIGNFNNITDDDVENYVKRNRDLQRLMKMVSNDLNESIISDITLACTNPDYYKDQEAKLRGVLANSKGGLKGEDYIKIAQSQSDFDERVNNFTLSSDIENLISKITGVLPWVFLVYIIILKVKEFIQQNEHPSPYRGKYIQRMLRIVAKILKDAKESSKGKLSETAESAKEIGDQIDGLIDSLKSIDSVIVASLMASFIYLNNRKKLQENSLESFSAISSSITCSNGIEPPISDEDSRPTVEPLPLSLNSGDLIGLNNLGVYDNCPINFSEPLVPHEPFELKVTNERLNSCDIEQGPDTPPQFSFGDVNSLASSRFGNDLATKAIIKNESNKIFNITVSKDQTVNSRTVLGTMGGARVYSPIDGIVLSTEKNKVIIGDISDPVNMYLEELIKESQDLYKELNETKYFIKDYYVDSWYPVMLRESPLIDASLNAKELEKIQYWTGGVWKRFESAQKEGKKIKENYEKGISDVTGKDNVQKKAENEQMYLIKEEVDKQEKTYYNGLLNVTRNATNKAKVTKPNESEFATLDFFFDLYESVLANWDQNEIIVPYRDELSKILTDRFFIDGWEVKKLKSRINSLCNELAEGTFFEKTQNYFKKMLQKYESSNKQISAVTTYVESLSNKNSNFTEDEKSAMTSKVMFIFNFVLEIIQKVDEEFEAEVNRYDATRNEANFIESYFSKIWKRYYEIPLELEELYKKMDDVGTTMTTYSIVTIDEEEYRYYCIGKERSCPIPSENGDDYLSPFSEYEYGDYTYWLKYCAIATLVGITNFPLGWGTGFPPPLGPIPFPVVYIPIKAFQLNWGFIVIGITITGIYPFPWVLFTNFSTDYHVPLADPAAVIKTQIAALKKNLTNQLKEFRQDTLKKYMDELKIKVDAINFEINENERNLTENKNNRPIKDAEEKKAEYIKRLTSWKVVNIKHETKIKELKIERYKLEIKYKIVYDAYSGAKVSDTPDPKIISIQKTEELIEKGFAKLDILVSSIDDLLAPLPITTDPETANFAFTLKNPKPINEFGKNLNDNINTGVLDPIVENFELKSDDLMSSNYSVPMAKSVINWNAYKNALLLAMPLIIAKDPFPKYENLKLTNLAWIPFLYKDWTIKGGQTYGFPGFPQYPIG